MGDPSGCRVLAWALLALLWVQKAEPQGSAELSWADAEAAKGSQRMDTAQRSFIIPPITVLPAMSPLNPAHNGRVCSTWGDFHYKTFDGDVFRFPGRCNYVFSAHCGAAYEDFNIQLRRGLAGARPTITHVVLKTQGLVLEVSNGSVLIDGRREKLPYSRAGLLVERSSDYVKVSVRLVLTFLWNGEDSALLELDPKYANQTCGLCGDFNGLPAVSEFYALNARLTPLQFGNLQKLDGPTEQCQDPQPSPATDSCPDTEGLCHRTLLGPAFSRCNALVDADPYVAACAQDLCRCPTCPCATFAEYSRQCAHAGGQPQNWRGPDLCPGTCPLNLQHQECGSPCADTCSNPERSQLCEDHCVDGCFCPPGTVLDDVTNTGCLPLDRCPCTHGGRTYAPGASFTTSCSACTCSGGLWQCQDLPCPGTCSVQGGSHISTYDEKLYDMHGDCSYVLSKECADSGFTVLAELRKCGLTDNENCLKTVMLSMDDGDTFIQIKANGEVLMNSIYTQLPVSAANLTMFRPSSFFIVVQTGLGLQLEVQLVPLMQVFLRLDPAYRGQMCGLCGNFNQNQADDFRTLSGVVEGTAAAFANTWKTQAACPNVRNSFEDPCSLSVENENYAQHWCALLTDPASAFSPCHSIINPAPFHSNCLFDTCNCEKSEDCLCAALSSYVRACAARGVLLSGWRAGVCTKYMSTCPKSQSYAYVVDTCQPTCRALSQTDVTCGVPFVPVDGCTCPRGTFLDDAGSCVPAEACPCYFRGSVVAPGEVVHDNGAVCSCARGKLSCLGAVEQTSKGCAAPMLYLDCSATPAGTPGAECLRSCHTLDVDCFSTHCVSGCVCPPGLVSDGSGGCVAEEDCPCLHNSATYRPGDSIRVDCNTCTCRNRRWECSSRPCLGTCVAYGDGHFITFDGERYSFEGSCEYTLAQDHCGGNGTANGTFRIVTENIPCGTTGVTCSKAIKIFLENYELILHEGTYKVVQRGPGADLPFKARYMGTHLAIETRRGLVVSWDRKTSVFIRLHQDYKGRVCGLCGNFDDNAVNDFTTRSQSVVGNALEFGNSWKFSPTCPDAPAPRDPCTANPYRKSWAQKQCSLINSATFQACRSQVDSTKYYEACVSDACACDSGGDCECFCTAVAAYAQACREVGVCVSWRSPDVCPLFCDYYNPQGECEWHYQPCGAPCLKTCRNPSGRCLVDLPGQEGCYPKCPPSKPFFSEDQMKCVAQCGCYDDEGNYYDVGTRVPTEENCQSCNCTPGGLRCTHSLKACKCTYEGRTYGYGDIIYNTTDGLGACLMAVCESNGTITRMALECPRTPATTPFTFTSTATPPFTATPPSTTGPVPMLSTVCVREQCHWSAWYDSGRPEPGMGGGDFETFENLRQRGHQVCPAPAQVAQVECRAQLLPDTPLEQLGQKVECSPSQGLRCLNSEQSPPLCHNYELRVLCCDYVTCGTPPGPGTSQTPAPVPLPTSTSIQATTTLTSRTTETQTASSSAAPTCRPRCRWTEWFDEDYPTSEEAGGDVESYDRIRRAGGHVCERPRDIECEAENFPGRRPEDLGQLVHCEPSFGLVCRNDQQMGLFKMCYNYRIRLLCCSRDHCGEHTPATTTTAPGTPTATAATPATSSATTAPGTPTATATTPATSSATTMKPSTTRMWTQPGSSPGVTRPPLGSTTAVPFLSTRPGLPKTSPSPSLTDTLMTSPTSPLGATKSTALTGVTVGTSQGPTPRSASPTTRASASTPGTVSVSPPSPSPPGASTPRGETPRETQGPAATTEATTSQGATGCEPKCEWTEWFDVDFPTSGVSGGDMETYDNIRAAGGKMCREPQKIECRAESYPEVSLDQIGQVVSCSLQAGLVCRNQDQKGPFSMCFNYNIRVLCCDPGCPRPPATTSVTFPGPSLRPTLPTTPSPPTPSTAGPTATSRCQPACHWTDWLDADRPRPGRFGGDIETYYNIHVAGGWHCTQPDAIECEAVLFPGVPAEELGQVVQCAVEYGLICRNSQQRKGETCHNYQIRVRCCDDYSHCPSSPGTTAAPSPSAGSTLTPVMPTTWATTLVGPSTGSRGTSQGRVPTTGPWETLPRGSSTALAPSSPTSTACQPRCAWTDWLDQSYPMPGASGGDFETYANLRAAGRPICERPVGLECRAERLPDVPLQQLGQVVQCQLEAGLVCRNRDQAGLFRMCFNYQIRVRCCDYSPCASTTTPGAPTTSTGMGQPTGMSTGVWTTTTTQPLLSSAGATERASIPTTEAGPSTARTTERASIPTTEAGPSTARTTERASIPTTEAGPSTARTTERASIPTTEAGPSTARTTERASIPTTEAGPSTATTTERASIPTTEAGPSTATTTERASIPTTEAGPSTARTTERASIPTTEAGPSTARTTERVPTTPTPGISLWTTQRLSVPSPSALPGTLTTTVKTAMPSAPHTAALSTSSVQTSPGIPSTRAPFGTTLPASSLKPTPTSTTSGTCTPRCRWTDWFDEDYPTPGPDGGDFETLSVLRSAGQDFCEQPQDIECRSEKLPDVRLEDVGQVVQCDLSLGLVCRNRDQAGLFRMCFNYLVRLLCCDDYSHCPSSPGTTAAPSPSAGSTLTPVMPTTWATTLVGPSTGSTGTSQGRVPTTGPWETLPRGSSTALAPSSPTSAACQPRCAWTDWLDQSYPMPGASGGDFETYANLRAAGRPICERPVGLECRAERLPDVPLQQLGQVVQCQLEAGLVCRNRDQAGLFRMCFNYQIRVRCCDYSPCASTTTPGAPTTSTGMGQPTGMSTGVWTTTTPQPLLSSAGATERASIPTTEAGPSTARTTERASIPTTEAGPPTATTTERASIPTTEAGPSTARTTERASIPTTEAGPSTARTTGRASIPTTEAGPSTARTTGRASIPTTEAGPSTARTTGRASIPTTEAGPSTARTTERVPTTPTPGISLWTTQRLSVPSPSALPGTLTTTVKTAMPSAPHTAALSTSSVQTSPGIPSTRAPFGTTLPASSLKPTPTSTTSGTCTPRCRWTDWFDEDYPTPGPDGGDFETLSVLRLAGQDFCEQPQDIECRSEKLPDVRLEDVGQVVQCDLSLGLVCRNRNQAGLFRMCFNYLVRLLCCDDYSHCPSSPGTTAAPAPSAGSTLTPVMPTTWATTLVGPSTGSRGTSQGRVPTTGPWETLPRGSSTAWAPSSPTSAACQPRCAWTDWLDQSYPMPGASGGDFETYANLRAAGRPICERPVGLECRAERLPDVPLQQLGQVVQCQLEAGLVCRNRDQAGLFRMCFNYQIRVRCCDYSSCANTTTPGAPTTSTGMGQPTGMSTGVWTTTTTQPLLSSAGTTERASIPTTEAGPSTARTTERASIPTTEAGPSTARTTERASIPTTEAGPSTARITERASIPTTEAGPSTARTTERASIPSTEAGPSTARTTERASIPTTEAGPSTARTTERASIPSTEAGPSTARTTGRASIPTTESGPSTARTTERASIPTTESGPSTASTTERVPTTPTPGISLWTTQRLSVPSPSALPGTLTTTVKTAMPSAPHTAALSTSSVQTSPGIPSTSPALGSTLPATSLKPTSTSTISTTSGVTSGACTPRCRWTDWFDEDYPIPIPDGGDFETLSVLHSAGHNFCEQPQDIECRSEKQPDVNLEDVGQVVQCDVSLGLVCRNRDQRGHFKVCHNYHVRLLCCDDYSHCASSPPGTTPQPPSSPPGTTPHPSILSTVRPWASPGVSTTPCLCRAFGQLFSPGDIVYNRTDRAGCHFYAVCNQDCELDRFQGACPTSSPQELPTSAPLTSPAPGCDLTDPPRQVNETWTLDDCTVARCEGDNRVVLLEPQPVANVTCVNGHLPVKVQSQQDPCQYRYECECSCSSWGGSHYVTFDGTPYSFLDNCTHVLMREIRPRHGNLSILLYNHYCGAAATSSRCSRALSVRYESTEVLLTTEPTNGQEEGLILFDGVRVNQGFSKNGVSVSMVASSTRRLDIPALGVSATFDGQVFQVRVPYGYFSHNTEGLCGTCTNSKTDDCRRPDGTIAPTCQDMASTWLVPEMDKGGCWAPTGPPPTTSAPAPAPSTPTSTPCPPAPLCELLLSHIFTECHGLIPPGLFFSTCVRDACQAGSPEVPCQSLEAYASLCRARGVCSDWRNATGGLCDLTCSPEKVYKPCGPVQPPSCDFRTQSPESQGLAEGCFCPDGLTLFNSHTDICVPECPCVGPDGFPKFPGEQWVSDCQACVCDVGSVTVQCAPLQCEAQARPRECGLAGFVTLTRPLADNPCCQETLCVCNTSTCPQSSPECGPGEELALTQEKGSCCPTFGCRPKLCTYNGTVYGVGATFPAAIPCHTCSCLSVDAEDPTVQCKEDACDTACPQGSQYSTVAGQCCGECIPTACLTPDGGLVQPDETWVNSLVDNCTEYHCQADNGIPVLVPRPSPCPDVTSCKGTLRKTGCCYSCEEVDSCQVRINRTVLGHQGCEAPVNLTFCEGFCPGVSKYSPEAQAVQRRCTCCQEIRAHEEAVTLQCPDGTAVRHTYTHIDECRCDLSCVPSPATPKHSFKV